MILSHRYRFIFLKTNKTASTSIEIALSKFCGDQDIITPISPEDEKTRTRLGYRGPQNYLCRAAMSDYRLKDMIRLLAMRRKKRRFYNHISATEVRKHVGETVWNSYYKFCFERNPWDRLVSLYYWRCRSGRHPTIAEFLDSPVPLELKRKGFDLYTIDGKVAVDRVCRFEDLTDELEFVRLRLGLPERLDLPRAKSAYRKDRRHYRQILSEQERGKIQQLFSEEISLFGYTF